MEAAEKASWDQANIRTHLHTERTVAKLLSAGTFAKLSTYFMDVLFCIRLRSRTMSNIGARNIYLFIKEED